MQTTQPRNVAPDFKKLRAILAGILFDCPLGGNPGECICHNIRKLSAHRRFEWLNELSDEECLEIYHNHILCLKRKAGRSDYASWPMTTGLDASGTPI